MFYTYLETLDFDTSKLDRSFAQKLASPRKEPLVAIVCAVLEIAGLLAVVAEGIEKREQLERFRSLGCLLLQGYYVGRPMPAEELAPRLQKATSSATTTLPRQHQITQTG